MAAGEPRWEDDDYPAKLELLLTSPVDLVSFTFGCPAVELVEQLHRAGSRVAVTVGAAAVYSFVTAPTFSAAISGGQIVIKQVKSDYKKLDVAAMLEIEPRAWDLGPLNLGVQLGVSPKSDIGLFLGLSLRATGFFTLGAGIAFQQVDRLAPGLSVGQMIASPDALKTEKKFRSGLYIHLTVTTQKKK